MTKNDKKCKKCAGQVTKTQMLKQKKTGHQNVNTKKVCVFKIRTRAFGEVFYCCLCYYR